MMKRMLCPRIPRINEPMVYVGFKVYESMHDEVEKISRGSAQTRSEVLRNLLIESLRARGRIASVEEMSQAIA